MATFYVLISIRDGHHYIGSTSNLSRRIKEHNRGQTKSTRFRRPFRLIYKEDFKTLKEAKQKEKLVKSYKGGEAFKKLINAGVVHR